MLKVGERAREKEVLLTIKIIYFLIVFHLFIFIYLFAGKNAGLAVYGGGDVGCLGHAHQDAHRPPAHIHGERTMAIP